MWNWYRQMLAAVPGSAVRVAERELEQARVELRCAKDDLARSAGRLKGLKAQPNANPQELGRQEGSVAAYSRRVLAAQRMIAELEQRLHALDPERSRRRSHAARTSP